jgi:acid phosphatase type 7
MLTEGDGLFSVTGPDGVVHTAAAEAIELPSSITGASANAFLYKATVSGLQPSTSYTYSISCNGSAVTSSLTVPQRLRTAPADEPFTFLHFADSGTGSAAQLALAAQMAQETPSLVLANGDLAYELGDYANFEANYFDIYRNMMAQTPFFSSLGNHEYDTDSAAPALSGTLTPTTGVQQSDWGRYYSFDWGNVHFVVLDSNAPLTAASTGDNSMLVWLASDLSATRKFWRVAFFHHPGYATGVHQNEPPAGMVRQYIVPVLESYGVQLVFNGHEHNYQRTAPMLGGQPVGQNGQGGIVYITSGGGGQPTYMSTLTSWIDIIESLNHYMRVQVSGPMMTLEAVIAGGQTVDNARIAPRPWVSGPVVDGASLAGPLASGGAATIFGLNLSSTEIHPEPGTKMAGDVAVRLEGTHLPILFADAQQINVQLPFSFSGTGTLDVITPNGMVSKGIQVVPVAPSIFVAQDGSGLAMAEHADGSMVSSTSPAHSGDIVTVMATGLGAVQGSPELGVAPAVAMPVVAAVQATVGGAAAKVIGASLSTKVAGVYLIQLQVPAGLSAAVPVVLTAGGVHSNSAVLPVA